MKIKLIDIAGEFCTSRKSPGLVEIRNQIEECLKRQEPILISRERVKILTPSFIDELLPDMVIAYGEDKVRKFVKFEPELDGYLAEQVHRGVAARMAR